MWASCAHLAIKKLKKFLVTNIMRQTFNCNNRNNFKDNASNFKTATCTRQAHWRVLLSCLLNKRTHKSGGACLRLFTWPLMETAHDNTHARAFPLYFLHLYVHEYKLHKNRVGRKRNKRMSTVFLFRPSPPSLCLCSRITNPPKLVLACTSTHNCADCLFMWLHFSALYTLKIQSKLTKLTSLIQPKNFVTYTGKIGSRSTKIINTSFWTLSPENHPSWIISCMDTIWKKRKK